MSNSASTRPNIIPTRFRVEFYDFSTGAMRIASIVVEAPDRGRAITAACRQTGFTRDQVASAQNLNPQSGGGSKRG